jgi:hypothetical protein
MTTMFGSAIPCRRAARFGPRPKLAVSTKQPLGAILDFLHDEIKPGVRTEMAEAYVAYVTWCKSKSLRPMSVAEFVDAMEKACRQFGIRISIDGGDQYLMGVQLQRSSVAANQETEGAVT